MRSFVPTTTASIADPRFCFLELTCNPCFGVREFPKKELLQAIFLGLRTFNTYDVYCTIWTEFVIGHSENEAQLPIPEIEIELSSAFKLDEEVDIHPFVPLVDHYNRSLYSHFFRPINGFDQLLSAYGDTTRRILSKRDPEPLWFTKIEQGSVDTNTILLKDHVKGAFALSRKPFALLPDESPRTVYPCQLVIGDYELTGKSLKTVLRPIVLDLEDSLGSPQHNLFLSATEAVSFWYFSVLKPDILEVPCTHTIVFAHKFELTPQLNACHFNSFPRIASRLDLDDSHPRMQSIIVPHFEPNEWKTGERPYFQWMLSRDDPLIAQVPPKILLRLRDTISQQNTEFIRFSLALLISVFAGAILALDLSDGLFEIHSKIRQDVVFKISVAWLLMVGAVFVGFVRRRN